LKAFRLVMKDILSQTKFGWIPFWNLLPFHHELSNFIDEGVTFQKGNPTVINRLLASGHVDLAPCSSVCLALNPEQDMAMPLGVVCDGKVLSVYLGLKSENRNLLNKIAERQAKISEALSKIAGMKTVDIRKKAALLLGMMSSSDVPLSELPSVKLSTASATSVMLTRILYRLWFGPESYKLACKLGKISENPAPTTNAVFELVIGDEALSKKRTYYHVLDLGSLWKDITGLPFVYAVWQSYKKIPVEVKNLFVSAAEKAEARMKVEPACYLPKMTPLDDTGKEIDLGEYWKKIYYRIGKKEMKALTFFLSLAKNLHPVERSDEITIKLMHMQELANRSV